jgi:hypothetical protein
MSFKPNFVIPVQISKAAKRNLGHYASVNSKKSLQIKKNVKE